MDVDWSVAAALDDPIVVVPWQGLSLATDPDDRAAIQYVDLKTEPGAIDRIGEAKAWPELGQTLVALNAADSAFCTVKCDAWALDDEELQLDFGPAVFGFGMYVDVLPVDKQRFSLMAAQRALVEAWTERLRRVPHEEGRVELVIRPAQWDGAPGFAITLYLFGYGDDEARARQNWGETARAICGLVADSTAGCADDTINGRASSSIG